MKNSRTKNTIYNFTTSIGGQLITISMQFVVRTVFIQTLGKSYLGINGLFSNILSMLSLAEFGVGSAILYKLYEPLAKNDQHRIQLLMRFYKKVYRVIGLAIAAIGLCLIPFLPMLISDYDSLQALRINAGFLFCLYLLKSVSSYLFFAYKTAIIKADQKEYIITVISYVFTISFSLLRIILLYTVCNFTLYVFTMVVQVIAQNLFCAIIANKMYPFINEKTDDSIPLSEVKDIFKDCAAIFLYKLNGVVLKATDNIVLSVFVGLEIVGEYSNYYVLFSTLQTLFSKVYNAVSHSLGNLHTTKDRAHEYKVFEAVNLIAVILGGTSGVGIFVCADDVVNAWIGKEWILQQPFSMLMGMEIYTMSLNYDLSKYRNTMGLFQQAKYRPVAGMIINLVVSIALVKNWGICGVLAGTLIAEWTTMMWFDPIIIHKYGFKNYQPVTRYFRKNIKYILTTATIAAIDRFICLHLTLPYVWGNAFLHIIIVGVTVPAALLGCSFYTEEGKYIRELIKREFRTIAKKLKSTGN